MRSTRFLFMAFVVVVLLVTLMAVLAGPQSGEAAPMPAPTPISASPRGIESNKINFFTAEVMTADTTSTCADVSAFEKADLYYNIDIDASNVNTHTIYLQHGNSPTALVDGLAIVSAVVADTSAMNQFQIFGGFLCVKVDVTTSDTVTVTANALVK